MCDICAALDSGKASGTVVGPAAPVVRPQLNALELASEATLAAFGAWGVASWSDDGIATRFEPASPRMNQAPELAVANRAGGDFVRADDVSDLFLGSWNLPFAGQDYFLAL